MPEAPPHPHLCLLGLLKLPDHFFLHKKASNFYQSIVATFRTKQAVNSQQSQAAAAFPHLPRRWQSWQSAEAALCSDIKYTSLSVLDMCLHVHMHALLMSMFPSKTHFPHKNVLRGHLLLTEHCKLPVGTYH